MANATGPGVNGQGGPGEAVQAAPGGQFLPHREVMIVLPGLLLAILLAMLDNLIVSTALPRIVGDLGIPVAFGMRSGHVSRANITLPIGVRARLEIGDGVKLRILESATEKR